MAKKVQNTTDVVTLQKVTTARPVTGKVSKPHTGLALFIASTALTGDAFKAVLDGLVKVLVDGLKAGTDAFWGDVDGQTVTVQTANGPATWTRGRSRRNLAAKMFTDALWGMVTHVTMGPEDRSHMKAESTYYPIADALGLSHWRKGDDVGAVDNDVTMIRHRLTALDVTLPDGTMSRAIRTIRSFGPAIVVGGYGPGSDWDRDKTATVTPVVVDYQ